MLTLERGGTHVLCCIVSLNFINIHISLLRKLQHKLVLVSGKGEAALPSLGLLTQRLVGVADLVHVISYCHIVFFVIFLVIVSI